MMAKPGHRAPVRGLRVSVARTVGERGGSVAVDTRLQAEARETKEAEA